MAIPMNENIGELETIFIDHAFRAKDGIENMNMTWGGFQFAADEIFRLGRISALDEVEKNLPDFEIPQAPQDYGAHGFNGAIRKVWEITKTVRSDTSG